jgi:hypothetical protein
MAAILQSLWMSHPCATPNTIIEPCAEPFPWNSNFQNPFLRDPRNL